jgi:MYXO-CTERM domain-containing protein
MKRLVTMLVCLPAFFSLAHASPITLFDSLADSADYVNPLIFQPFYTGVDNSFSTGGNEFIMTNVEVPLELTGIPTNGEFTVALYSDLATTPGSELALLGTMSDTSLTDTLTDYNFPTSIDLAPHTRYWIGISSSLAFPSVAGWGFTFSPSGPGVLPEFVGYPGAGYSISQNSQAFLMDVTGSNAPEPSTVLLGVIGLAMLAAYRRRVAV